MTNNKIIINNITEGGILIVFQILKKLLDLPLDFQYAVVQKHSVGAISNLEVINLLWLSYCTGPEFFSWLVQLLPFNYTTYWQGSSTICIQIVLTSLSGAQQELIHSIVHTINNK